MVSIPIYISATLLPPLKYLVESKNIPLQTCLNSPDPPPVPTANCDQRMSATGYEETELTYNVNEEEQQKVITTHLILFHINRS